MRGMAKKSSKRSKKFFDKKKHDSVRAGPVSVKGVDPAKLSEGELERYPVLQLWLAKIDDLLNDPRNARTHNEVNLEAIRNSLEDYGQRKNVVVSADGIVRAGNGTLIAAKQLGWEHIVCGPAPVDLVKARGFAFVDNRSGELSGWADAILKTEMLDLATLGYDVTKLGWTEDEIADLLYGGSDGGSGGGVTVPPVETIFFKLGDVVGRVSKEVEQSFRSKYEKSKKASGGGVLLDDVLRSWLKL